MDDERWKCVECNSVFKNKWPQCPTCDCEELVSVSGNSKPSKVITAVEIDPMKNLYNLTQLNNLQYLNPISEHLWWLALMAKIALVMIVLQFIFMLALFS